MGLTGYWYFLAQLYAKSRTRLFDDDGLARVQYVLTFRTVPKTGILNKVPVICLTQFEGSVRRNQNELTMLLRYCFV